MVLPGMFLRAYDLASNFMSEDLSCTVSKIIQKGSMQQETRTDVIIVGAGPSGLVLATALAQRKISVHHVPHLKDIGAQANEHVSLSSLKRM